MACRAIALILITSTFDSMSAHRSSCRIVCKISCVDEKRVVHELDNSNHLCYLVRLSKVLQILLTPMKKVTFDFSIFLSLRRCKNNIKVSLQDVPITERHYKS